MATPSMQIFMDSSDWLKCWDVLPMGNVIRACPEGIVQEDTGTTNSSSPSSELISCSKPPVIEKRLRPPHDQALKCPRCDSTHTKFCYYNNYSLSQPRYFCKTCRRYWTKGGTLRNVPVGGGCRKNKRSSGKKTVDLLPPSASVSLQEATSLHQPFPLVQLPHLEPLSNANSRNIDFMECKYNFMLDNPMDCLDLMDTKFGAIFSRSHLPMAGAGGGSSGLGEPSHGFASSAFHSVNATGFSIDGNHAALMEACQRLSLPFEVQEEASAVEVKPSERILSMEWPDQYCGDVGREAMGYSNGIGSWAAGMVNGRGGSSRPSELEFS